MQIYYDGRNYEFPLKTSPLGIAKKLDVSLKDVIAAKIDSGPIDLKREIDHDTKIEFLTFKDREGRQIFWHSSAHVLAAAVKKLHPNAVITLGPPIDEGFYYDFYNLSLGDNDLPTLEKEMQKTIEADENFIRKEVTKEEALTIFGSNKFKKEILETEVKPPITMYENGGFLDLCRGPHIPSTRYIKAVKLLKVAGAYWRGDSKREVLTRIYGVTFPSKHDLEEYIKLEAERYKHDHKRIGKELQLFELSPLSPGSPFFLPKGAVIYNELLRLAREMDRKYGYEEIITPIIAKSDVWKTSGHYEKYRENMYGVEPLSNKDEEYILKPMNCPFSTVVFRSKTRSYRDLPLRLADYGMLHRYELEGTLDGLMRTRMMEQNDAHIYVTEDNLADEVARLFSYTKEIYSLFKFEPVMRLATRPEHRIGSEEQWDKAENILKNALDDSGYNYEIKEGDGAFYGPKIDIYVLDFTGKPENAYAVSTIQIDFNLAERFDAKYINHDNRMSTPVVIHRSIIGTIGRFMGIILENSAGELPVWLSPVQVRILTITERNDDYAKKIYDAMFAAGIRVELDNSNSTLDYKIRHSQLMKVPYTMVIGDKESQNGTIAVRDRNGKTKYGVSAEDFIKELVDISKNRSI